MVFAELFPQLDRGYLLFEFFDGLIVSPGGLLHPWQLQWLASGEPQLVDRDLGVAWVRLPGNPSGLSRHHPVEDFYLLGLSLQWAKSLGFDIELLLQHPLKLFQAIGGPF